MSSKTSARLSRRIYLISAIVTVAVFLFSFTTIHRLFKSEIMVDDILLAVLAGAAVMGFLYGGELHQRELEAHKLRTLKATMTTVQDLVGNFLCNMQYVREETAFCMSKDTMELFDQLISQVQAHVKALGDVDRVREKKMAIGMGIHYPAPPSSTEADKQSPTVQ
jgi:hypothetical protein